MTTDQHQCVATDSDRWVRLAGEDRDSSIDGFELTAAKRALALLKGRLGRDSLLELLKDEIDSATAYLRAEVERSAGEESSGTTTLHARGITATEFSAWLSRAFGREDVLIAGHPEHYSIHAGAGGVNIVETLGDYVCSFYMHPWDDAATAEVELPDDGDAPQGRRSRMALADGTVIGSISNSFADVPGGFEARLSVTLPVTCGPVVVEHHLEHFAVEFRNWILAAAAEQASVGAVGV
ncbi:hypothetical protein E5720_17860 [Rhodococcus sp. PAMC28707]|uniref:hypothetical protein n=1 Tax=unclassified Rhodococcus (in: high G+C Gram-positive bacteria) TaxID=192944 RepID=UPI00109DE601|nr:MULTISPECIES: hypothetical protein [unclassified Rhodococcus (in: high G+C Gram-positive bacteria)]QCB51758.1 hypothetical protein E5769_17665 [Rhodococcus sp. PAMC28705]QCB60074.1 hypothetical protein E5720_17860 [Rhodococcus sp. PAMC28707]